jgi:hypothetical protein
VVKVTGALGDCTGHWWNSSTARDGGYEPAASSFGVTAETAETEGV